uniref:Disks large-associated protein 5 n=1 Tax=Strigamia maritima TaxID=126957 RepID=T1JAY2_STRMM
MDFRGSFLTDQSNGSMVWVIVQLANHDRQRCFGMQHSHEFKRRGVNFSVDGRQLRAYRRSTDRKSWRDDIIMKRRCSSSDSLNIASKPGKKNGSKLSPLKERNEEVKQPIKKLTGPEERRLQLNKYKERKQLLKELEKQQKQSKPVFKVCQIKRKYDPFAPVDSIKTKIVKPVATETRRVTRASAKIAAAAEKPKEVAVKVKPILKSQAGKRMKNPVKKGETKAQRVSVVSFAPDGFQFTAPVNLKYPSPKKASSAPEKCNYEFLDKVEEKIEFSDIVAKKIEFSDIVAKKIEFSDDDEVETNEIISKEILPDIPKETTDELESVIDDEMKNNISPCSQKEIDDGSELNIDSNKLISDILPDVIQSEPNNLSIIQEKGCEIEPTTCDTAEVVEKDQSETSKSENETQEPIQAEETVSVGKVDDSLEISKGQSEAKELENDAPKPIQDEVVEMDDNLEFRISPFVTTTRGSSSRKQRRKSQKPTYDSSLIRNCEKEFQLEDAREKLMENGTESKTISDCQENNENVNSPTKINLLDRFKGLVTSYRTSFSLKINFWVNNKVADDVPVAAGNEIDCVVGMAELLMKQRFSQFEDLIADCEFNRGEKKTTCDDLLGFWEMIFHQVTNIEAKFEKLDKMKKDNWKSQTPKPKRGKRRAKKATPKAKPTAKPSQLREHIAAARKSKQAAPLKTDSNDSKETPVSEKKIRPKRSTVKRDGSISYLLKPTTPGSDNDDAFFSAENEENVIDKIVQSVLATSSDGTPSINEAQSPLIDISKKKLRRSVRFALSTKTNACDDVPSFRTTPFTRRQKSSLASSSSEENHTSISDSFVTIPEDYSCSSLTPSSSKKKKRKVSSLPVPNEDDLISFSPCEKRRRTRSFSKAN